MLFILVAGMPGSGKSVVAAAAREMGIPVYTMGDVVREETLRRFGEVTIEKMVETSIALRKEFGEDVVAVRTAERALGSNSRVVVIDGVRSLREVEVFARYGEVAIVAVHASPKTRFARLLLRKRPGDPASWEEFRMRDLSELSLGIGSVIALADYVIVNESTLEEALGKAREILRKLAGEHYANKG